MIIGLCPGISIASDGPVASVAIFSKVPTRAIRSIALDTSSRTSQALLRVLCARWFEIDPRFVNLPPDLPQMLQRCDAALVIGDNALFGDHESLGVEKIDLGEEWHGMTGLPFVYAFWAGRPDAIGPAEIAALQATRDRGVAAAATIGRQAYPEDAEKASRADALSPGGCEVRFRRAGDRGFDPILRVGSRSRGDGHQRQYPPCVL